MDLHSFGVCIINNSAEQIKVNRDAIHPNKYVYVSLLIMHISSLEVCVSSRLP